MSWTGNQEGYEDYVVVLPAKEAMQIANVLARIGMIFADVRLIVEEDGAPSPLFSLYPSEVREAHNNILEAQTHNWLGANPEKEAHLN